MVVTPRRAASASAARAARRFSSREGSGITRRTRSIALSIRMPVGSPACVALDACRPAGRASRGRCRPASAPASWRAPGGRRAGCTRTGWSGVTASVDQPRRQPAARPAAGGPSCPAGSRRPAAASRACASRRSRQVRLVRRRAQVDREQAVPALEEVHVRVVEARAPPGGRAGRRRACAGRSGRARRDRVRSRSRGPRGAASACARGRPGPARSTRRAARGRPAPGHRERSCRPPPAAPPSSCRRAAPCRPRSARTSARMRSFSGSLASAGRRPPAGRAAAARRTARRSRSSPPTSPSVKNRNTVAAARAAPRPPPGSRRSGRRASRPRPRPGGRQHARAAGRGLELDERVVAGARVAHGARGGVHDRVGHGDERARVQVRRTGCGWPPSAACPASQ